jgi:hypothetical protein
MKKLIFIICILGLYSCTCSCPSDSIREKAKKIEHEYIVPEKCYSAFDIHQNIEHRFYIITIKDHEYIWVDNETDMLIHSASCSCKNKTNSSLYNW